MSNDNLWFRNFVFWLGIAGYLAHSLEKRARTYGACHLSVTHIWTWEDRIIFPVGDTNKPEDILLILLNIDETVMFFLFCIGLVKLVELGELN